MKALKPLLPAFCSTRFLRSSVDRCDHHQKMLLLPQQTKLAGPFLGLMPTQLSPLVQLASHFCSPPPEPPDLQFPGPGSITATTLKNSLEAEKVAFKESHACYKLNCPVCATKSSTLVNKNTGKWLCENCQAKGNWSNYLHLRKATKVQLKNFKTDQDKKRMEEHLSLTSMLDDPVAKMDQRELVDLLKAVKLTGISQATLVALNCHVVRDKRWLLFPVSGTDGKLLAVRALVPTDDKVGFAEKVFPTGSVVPFGVDRSGSEIGGSVVVVTSSIQDALAIYDRTGVTAVSLPHGMHRVPPDCLFWLENWEKVVIWFGSDQQAWPAVRALAKKLGEPRCYYVSPGQWDLGPFKAIGQKVNVSKIVSEARPVSHKDIAAFPNLREHVKAELSLADQARGVKWKRFKGLNKILAGHRRGELTVLTGQTGTGKTTFMSEYSLDLCMSGVATLWGSFEVQPVRLAKVMLMQFSGTDLELHLGDFDRWADEFEKLPMYFTTLHGQTGLTQVLDAMSHAVYMHDIHHVVLDNLQFMLGHGGMDRFARQDAAIASFRKFATSHNCHVTLVIHPRKEGYSDDDQLTVASIFGGAKASQEADNVLILQDRRLKIGASRKKYLQVAKNRFSGDLGILPLEFDKSSRSFAIKSHVLPKKKVENHPESEKVVNR